ncbi:MAG TPA: response regulator [Verrucomicrobiae bacterium]
MGTEGHDGQKVLVIDDDPVMHRLFQNILHHASYEVVVASTGVEGIQLAEREAPLLVILDYVMPDMDGLDTLKELKKRQATKGIPVLIATGFLDAMVNEQFLAAGAAACLSKPFSAPVLLDLVQKLVVPLAPSNGCSV